MSESRYSHGRRDIDNYKKTNYVNSQTISFDEVHERVENGNFIQIEFGHSRRGNLACSILSSITCSRCDYNTCRCTCVDVFLMKISVLFLRSLAGIFVSIQLLS